MTDRTLIKGAIVLTQDDELGELPNADILIEDDRIARIGQNLDAEGATVIDATGDIVIPGFIDTHRHTWETSIRTSRAGLHPRCVLRRDPRQVRPELPTRRRVRRQPVGLAGVHQRGDHVARRLVAHHEHARPRRRGHPRSPGVRHPLGLRIRLPEHLHPGMVVRSGLRRQCRADRRGPTRAASARRT